MIEKHWVPSADHMAGGAFPLSRKAPPAATEPPLPFCERPPATPEVNVIGIEFPDFAEKLTNLFLIRQINRISLVPSGKREMARSVFSF